MSLTLEQIAARLTDPSTPVVWLDPSIPEDIWAGLPDALAERGITVLDLDDGEPVVDEASLLERLAQAAALPGHVAYDLPALRESLVKLPHRGVKGWVVLFRRPEALRQNNEAVFEELLETLEMVHETLYEMHHKTFTLAVRD